MVLKTKLPKRATHPEVIWKLGKVCEHLGTGTCCFCLNIWQGWKRFLVIFCPSICPFVFLWNRTSIYIDLLLKWSLKWHSSPQGHKTDRPESPLLPILGCPSWSCILGIAITCHRTLREPRLSIGHRERNNSFVICKLEWMDRTETVWQKSWSVWCWQWHLCW